MTAALAPDVRIACAGVDPDLFHPQLRSRDDIAAAQQTALRYCASCPAFAACDAAAQDAQGIWAGQHRYLDGAGHLHITDLLTDPPTTHTRKVTRR